MVRYLLRSVPAWTEEEFSDAEENVHHVILEIWGSTVQSLGSSTQTCDFICAVICTFLMLLWQQWLLDTFVKLFGLDEIDEFEPLLVYFVITMTNAFTGNLTQFVWSCDAQISFTSVTKCVVNINSACYLVVSESWAGLVQ